MPKNFQLKVNLVGTSNIESADDVKQNFIAKLRAIAGAIEAGSDKGMWPMSDGTTCGSWIMRDINKD